MEKPVIVEIEKTIDETDGIKTIFIKHSIEAKPGQFVMVWIPGLDEKPFAISYLEKEKFGITVAAVGEFSDNLSKMKEGDKVGLRGPYGTNYCLEGNNIVMVGGGYGAASLVLLAEQALDKNMNIKFILGARDKNKLLYIERIKKLVGEENLIITTDDGSMGAKGFVTDALKELLSKEKVDKVFSCGPDKMMKSVTELCTENNVKGEISMERWMKCGFGLCGHCCVDPIGIRVCKEGPVIDFELANKITELGSYHRVKSSRKESLEVKK
ncbi:dihydroorotate dehydrogenase electron transfer subunit [Candidatus Woesearchaeota archaeon]|nr:dihydroorotate dehydrogenase electron transfer subunit [Candidatus Woesearchaeota archaeon]|tara:strand:+ start:4518 stop:5324 length:807 start_codon:yes stop_codon:yes gene_type:complete